MNRVFLFSFLLVALTGCVIPADSGESYEAADNDLICFKEKKTGSNRSVNVCRRRDTSPIKDEQAQRDLRDLQRQSQAYREIQTN